MSDRTFKIYAAHARSKTEFAIGMKLSPLDAEDMFSIVLTYNADTPKQPWSRDDIPRPISSITLSNIDTPTRYAALSSEGDVYHISDTENYIYEKIEGAGLYSEDAKGFGATTEIANIEGTLFVVGLGRQVYKSDGKKWEKIDAEAFETAGYIEEIDFNSIGGASRTNLIITAREQVSSADDDEIPQELLDASLAARQADDFDEFSRIEDEIEKHKKPRIVPKGRGFHFNGTNWNELDVEDEYPAAVFIDSQKRAWLGGAGNATLLLVDEDGDIDQIEIDEDNQGSILSITEFKDRFILANDYGLYAYNENHDSMDDEVVRIKPKLNKKLHTEPTPLKVQAVDDVMYYFDYNLGIYIWDGDKKWTNIPIPPELLEREFKGLKN